MAKRRSASEDNVKPHTRQTSGPDIAQGVMEGEEECAPAQVIRRCRPLDLWVARRPYIAEGKEEV